jgi:hypothetical protein
MFATRSFWSVRTAAAALIALAWGCDSAETETLPVVVPGPVATPTVLSFEADSPILAGDAATLTWRTRNAVAVAIADDQGRQLALDGAGIGEGSVEVQPTETTTYTLTATGAEGVAGPAWRAATVTVEAARTPAPTIEEFTASATPVAVGEPVVLAWRTSNATALTLKDDAGVAIDLGDATPDAGQVTVRPARATTTYFLTATGGGVRATARLAVEATGLPRVTRFFVDPLAPVAPGETVTVTWETANATQIRLRQDDAVLLESATQLSGSLDVTLENTASFSLEATGAGGTATATALARVGARIAAFTASTRVVRAGDPVVFSWAIEEADRAVIDGPGGYHRTIAAEEFAAGTTTVDVTVGGAFVLQAFRGDVPRSAALAIEITEAPRVRSFACEGSPVTAAADLPATVNCAWTQDGGDTCTVYANNAPVEGYQGLPCGTTGSASVSVFGTSTIRLEAVNAAGGHSASAVVEALPPARVVAFAGQPNRRLAPGDQIQLAWTVTDAVSVSMEKDAAPFAIGATSFSGSATDTVGAADATYELTAQNALGFPTRAEVTVRVGAPAILAAAATPSFVALGQETTIAWTVDGGDTLAVTAPDGTEVFRTTDPAAIDHGAAPILAPVVAGAYPYTVAVTNGAGTTQATVDLTVSDGPMISAFAASKAQLSLGEALTFSWSVANDPSGAVPTLALTDDHGHAYPEIATKNANNGSLTVTPLEEGPHVYTLAASTPGRTVARATATVEITVAPVVSSFTATPDRTSTGGGQVVPDVVLAWQTQNAVELTLWESDALGNVIPPTFYRLSLANHDPQAILDAGSFTVHPTATTWYLVRAKNRIGSQVDARVKVVVDPPEVLSFTATPREVVEGQTVHLAWTTRNASTVTLDPSVFFVDIANRPGATKGALVNDSAVVTIPFPAGFTFPFEGTPRTEMQATTNGTAGFNTANTSSTNYSGALPNSYGAHAHLLPYGCDLDSDNSTPNGELWYGTAADARGDFFVVEWKNWGWWSSSYNPSNLNFEIVLRRDGTFEFRYGDMSAAVAARAAGEGCSIGYQGTTATMPHAQLVPYQQALPGGLANRGFVLPSLPSLPVNGSLDVTPSLTTTFRLSAANADASTTAETAVTVWKNPIVASVRTTPLAPVATRPFQIAWTTQFANGVRVLDATGAAICTATAPADVAAGSCTATAATPGLKTFTIEAVNGPPGAPMATATRPVSVTVYPYLAVTSFELQPGSFVNSGDAVTLAWTASPAAVDMTLWACVPKPVHANCVDITPANYNPQAGSTTYRVTASTEFWLQVFDVQTMAAEASRFAWVGANQVDLTAAKTQLAAGESTTLSWNITGTQEFVETTGTLPFIDLTGIGTSVTRSGSAGSGNFTVNFPAGFTFPWFGSNKTGLKANVDGWITFNMSDASSDTTNYALPTSSTYDEVQIAPFWDYLEQVAPADLLWYQGQTSTGLKYVVVEWKDFELYYDSASSLNFEVILWQNGDLDFRYGTMTGSGSYADDARGSSATIGYQSPNLATAWQFSYNTEILDLAGRSFRRSFGGAAGSSTSTVTPTESTTYRLCASNASQYDACDEVRVVVVKPGDLLFTEAMIAPTAAAAEWFELKNLAPDPIDLAGFVLASGPEQFPIPATPPLVVPPGAYAVFARSGDAAVNGGLSPTLVYDTLGLDDVTDSLGLFMGAIPIDTITWGAGWNIQANRSVAFEPTLATRSPAANDPATAWCPTTAVYGNGTFGGSPGTAGAGCLPPP